jgi:hypothetical protein
MKNQIRLLRICYWWGIVVDGVVAIQMMFPEFYLRFYGVDLEPGAGVRYGLLKGVPLMIGWTLLLFWADRKPMERKDILLLTLPVIVGYAVVAGYAITAGLSTWSQAFPVFLSQGVLCTLFIFSYLNATKPRPESS